MKTLFDQQSLVMQAGQVVSGRVARNRMLRVNSGRIWLTVEGQLEDYWLGDGQSFTLGPRSLVVMEAEQQTCIEILPVVRKRNFLRLLFSFRLVCVQNQGSVPSPASAGEG